MIPVFTSKDYGMIAAINQTTSGDSQWLVVLGFLKIKILLETIVEIQDATGCFR
jgi:hypothetical protein